MTVTVERGEWNGWTQVYSIDNGAMTMRVVADVGPRVLHLSLDGGENLLRVYDAQAGQTGGSAFRLYGGHRLWHAPEDPERTYYPDNEPVAVKQDGDRVQFTAKKEITTGIQKSVAVTMAAEDARATLTHRLTNHNAWAVTFAPWSLTVMRTGGVAVLPLPPRGSHPEGLLPTGALALWPYTDMSDPRWTWGEQYVLLRGTSGHQVAPQKIGATVTDGWLAHVLDGVMFVKQFDYTPGDYPDRGSNAELFTNGEMLEVESLGHLQTVEPGETVTHVERWSLHGDVPAPENDDDVVASVLPRIPQVT